MLRLMTPYSHTKPSPNTTSQNSQQEQGRLRNSPFSLFSLEFINTINIRDNKVYDFVSWLIDNGQALTEFSADELYVV